MRLRALLLAALVGISLTTVPAVHAKAPVSGASCSKLNSTQIFQGKRFTCIKSGKKLVWNKGVIIKATPQPSATTSASTSTTPSASVSESPSALPIPTPTPSPTPSKVGYTMDQVKANNSSASCWSVIEGNVYDLTRWINSHPGGAGVIRGLCGIDGTQEFNRQHYGQRDPLQRLKLYLLGPLSK